MVSDIVSQEDALMHSWSDGAERSGNGGSVIRLFATKSRQNLTPPV